MEKEKTNNATTTNTCYFCELPLGEEYIVYKGIKVHTMCYNVVDGKFEPNELAENSKRLSKALKEKPMTLSELAEVIGGYQSTSKPRVSRVIHYMRDLGAVVEGEEERTRTVVRKVKVWKIK